MFPGKLGLFSLDLNLGLGYHVTPNLMGRNQELAKNIFPGFSKLHLDAGGLNGCPQVAARGQFD